MEEIRLKINQTPPLKCYLWQLHPLSVIFANDEEKYMPWLFNHYYNFEMIPDFGKEILILEQEPWCFEGEDIFKMKDFSALITACDEIIFFRLMKNMMKLGYFCITNVNEKYIPGMPCYRKNNLYHSCLICSLNDKNDTVEIFGYLKNSIIGKLKVDCHDIYKAIEDDIYTPETFYVRYFKVNEDFKCDCFDFSKFKYKINQYLNDSYGHRGIQCLLRLKSILIENTNYIDIRNIYILYEHKFLMYKRLEYVKNKKLITDYSIVEDYKSVLNKCNTMKILALMFKQTNNLEIPKRLVSILQDVIELDCSILGKLLDHIT